MLRGAEHVLSWLDNNWHWRTPPAPHGGIRRGILVVVAGGSVHVLLEGVSCGCGVCRVRVGGVETVFYI